MYLQDDRGTTVRIDRFVRWEPPMRSVDPSDDQSERKEQPFVDCEHHFFKSASQFKTSVRGVEATSSTRLLTRKRLPSGDSA